MSYKQGDLIRSATATRPGGMTAMTSFDQPIKIYVDERAHGSWSIFIGTVTCANIPIFEHEMDPRHRDAGFDINDAITEVTRIFAARFADALFNAGGGAEVLA